MASAFGPAAEVAPIGHVARRTVVIVKILSHLGLPTRGPPRAPARRVELSRRSEEPKAACQRRRRRSLCVRPSVSIRNISLASRLLSGQADRYNSGFFIKQKRN